MNKENVYFRIETVTKNGTILQLDDVIAVGFVNLGENTAAVNKLPLPPVPDPLKYAIAQYILWMPVDGNQKDATRYQITFGKNDGDPILVQELTVFYKMYRR